jgi:signal transduction histidine kinase
VRVSDTGRGIPEERQRDIFDPFVQLEAIDEKHAPGAGLGLAVVRQVATALGARVTVSSRLGEGSSFTLVLPST